MNLFPKSWRLFLWGYVITNKTDKTVCSKTLEVSAGPIEFVVDNGKLIIAKSIPDVGF